MRATPQMRPGLHRRGQGCRLRASDVGGLASRPPQGRREPDAQSIHRRRQVEDQPAACRCSAKERVGSTGCAAALAQQGGSEPRRRRRRLRGGDSLLGRAIPVGRHGGGFARRLLGRAHLRVAGRPRTGDPVAAQGARGCAGQPPPAGEAGRSPGGSLRLRWRCGHLRSAASARAGRRLRPRRVGHVPQRNRTRGRSAGAARSARCAEPGGASDSINGPPP